MSLGRSDDGYLGCPKTGKRIEVRQRYWWVRWLFPLVGLVSLVWFLLRVIPKPARAAYPCQRVAGGLAGGFLVWIAGMVGSVFAFRRGKQLFLHSRLGKAVLCLVIAAVAGIIALERMPEKLIWAGPAAANKPLGVGRGIHAGRVVWVHDPNVTSWTFPGAQTYGGHPGSWNGETDMGTYGYWYEHTDQTVMDQMVSDAIRGLAGESTVAAAWDAIFVNFNEGRGKGSVGYQAGEKFMIKVNYSVTNRSDSRMNLSTGVQNEHKGWIATSPQIILSVLRELVNVVGVNQSDITVGDTTAYFPNHLYSILNGEFPNVNYLDAGSGLPGRLTVQTSKGTGWDKPIDWSTPVADSRYEQDYLPLSYARAEYLINLPTLKAHYSGITVCGKNHFGSLIRLPDPCYMGDGAYYRLHHGIPGAAGWYSPGLGFWRPMVDMMGHSHLGEKTVLYLIDGIYGGYKWEGRPYRWTNVFGGEWPCSVFASQDPVAIDSVAYDFLLTEWPSIVAAAMLEGGAEDYLHEAALADDPCSGETYHPDPYSGPLNASLGVHEHWNNATDKQYTRNLGTGNGIELYIPVGTGGSTPPPDEEPPDEEPPVIKPVPLENRDMGLVVTEVTVKAGKKRAAGKDSITIRGELPRVLVGDMPYALYVAESISVLIENADAADDYGTIVDDIIAVKPGYMKNLVFSYNKRRSKEETTLTSLKLDFRKHTFSLTAKKIDLSGLKSDFVLLITFGAYIGLVEVDESMVNAGEGVPLALLAGQADRLSVDKVKFKFHKETSKDCAIQAKFRCNGSFSVSGGITVKGDDPCVDLTSDPDRVFWLDVAVEGRGMLTVDIPESALVEKKPNVFMVKRYELTGLAEPGKGPLVNAKFDFNKRTFSMTVKRLCLPAMDMEPGVMLETELGFARVGEDFERMAVFWYTGRPLVAVEYAFANCGSGGDLDGDGIGDDIDLCPDTPAGARDSVDAFGCPVAMVSAVNGDGDRDGVDDYLDLCLDTTRGSWIDDFGCKAVDSDGDGVFDPCDACPGTDPNVLVDAGGCQILDGDGDGDGDDDDPPVDVPAGMRTIPRGAMVLDGNLDEWDGVEWIDLNSLYYGDPDARDVTEAKFAVRWDEASSSIYVAVIVIDTDDFRTDDFGPLGVGWDDGDRIEILSVGDGEVALDWDQDHDVGQEYVVGVTPSGGSWASWGTGDTLQADTGLEYAAREVRANEYAYEAVVRQFDNYSGFTEQNGPTVITDLSVGHIVRFDIIVNTRHTAGFGMKAVDSNGGRYRDSGLITEFMLVE